MGALIRFLTELKILFLPNEQSINSQNTSLAQGSIFLFIPKNVNKIMDKLVYKYVDNPVDSSFFQKNKITSNGE